MTSLLPANSIATFEGLLTKFLAVANADPSVSMQLAKDIDTILRILRNGGSSSTGSASETTLSALSTKIDSTNSLLTSISTEDYATQTTLATRASEATLSSVASTLTAIATDIDSLAVEDYATQATLAAVQTQLTTVLTRLTEIRDRLPNISSPSTVTPGFRAANNIGGSTALAGTIPSGKKFIYWICYSGTLTVNNVGIFTAGTGDIKTYDRENGVIYPSISYSVSAGGNALFSFAPE